MTLLTTVRTRVAVAARPPRRASPDGCRLDHCQLTRLIKKQTQNELPNIQLLLIALFISHKLLWIAWTRVTPRPQCVRLFKNFNSNLIYLVVYNWELYTNHYYFQIKMSVLVPDSTGKQQKNVKYHYQPAKLVGIWLFSGCESDNVVSTLFQQQVFNHNFNIVILTLFQRCFNIRFST